MSAGNKGTSEQQALGSTITYGRRYGLLALLGLTTGDDAWMLGAFFIATDPVSSPLTGKGRWIFGIGVGAFTMLIRRL